MDETERLHTILVIGAVAVLKPLGRYDETDILVESDRLGRHAGAGRRLADRQHAIRLHRGCAAHTFQ